MTNNNTNEQVSNQDILDAIGEYSNKVDLEIKEMKQDIKQIKASMVTKDYLDEKMADLRGDLVVMLRKEDTKVRALTDLLCQKNIITTEEQKRIFGMEPFAQLA